MFALSHVYKLGIVSPLLNAGDKILKGVTWGWLPPLVAFMLLLLQPMHDAMETSITGISKRNGAIIILKELQTYRIS